jgi:hypothetical protein
MAVTKCPDCGSDVSTQAPTCPKCGRPNSQKAGKAVGRGCGAVLFICVIIVVLAAVFSGGGKGTLSSAAKPVDLNDASALDGRYANVSAQTCADHANAYLRHAARYDFKWDHVSSLEHRFNRYITVVLAPGVLTILTDRLELQNGFGGYQRVTLYCDYDTQTQKVLRYRIAQ